MVNLTQDKNERIGDLCVRIDQYVDYLLYLFHGEKCLIDRREPDYVKMELLRSSLLPKWYEKIEPRISNGEIDSYVQLREELINMEHAGRNSDSRHSKASSIEEFSRLLHRPRGGQRQSESKFDVGMTETTSGNDAPSGVGHVRVNCNVGGVELEVGVDSCSGANIMPIELVEPNEWKILPSRRRVCGVGGWSKVVGQVVLPLHLLDDTEVEGDISFLVLRSDIPYPLLGTEGQVKLDLVPDAVRSRIWTHGLQRFVEAQVVDGTQPAFLGA